ncbi:Gfo/Idh/MocA family oxidoreductase [uncultured Desulfosarcina sp.]|uniref:Gfo/Idh/MocA family protein n=1 Tax=uncultured Desulfosarcina sp. TaxID=218289 RepID=UPI0029C7858C|nr:Gfo/Idh/MocA family oxidoreductase [uncultured Desulfosarcina sp.]
MLNAGFIGMGRMGITHYSILNTHPSVKVLAIADTSKTMRNILDKYLSVDTFSDYRQMIENTPLDFVVVSTPTDSHAEVINFALAHGIHVFTEKPLAMTPAESGAVVALAEKRQLVNQVGYVNRFNEVFVEVKRLLDSGAIGDLKSFTSEMYGATVLKGSNATWRSKRKSGGGCMYEFASHCLDLVVYFLGQPDRVAGSVLKSIYSSHVEDMVTSTLIYDSGLSGTVTVNWSDESFRKPANIVSFFGSRGKIIADKHAFKIFLKEDQPQIGFHEGWNTRYITDFARSVRVYVRGNEFTRQLDYFVDAILERKVDNPAGFSEGHETDVLMDKITIDAASVANPGTLQPDAPPTVTGLSSKPSFWKKISKRMGTKHA